MYKVVKMLILCLMIVIAFLVFSQETKDIKMEVFEKEGKVLPFFAVEENKRAVTDLKKREIVLLVNGRNFRDFSLVYPSSRSRRPVFADAPKHSAYDIVFPYTSALKTVTEIRLGTSRTGVQLHTLKSLTINRPQKKIISVGILIAADQGDQLSSSSPQVLRGISTGRDTFKPISKLSPVSLPDTKTNVLKELKKVQLSLPDRASRNYCEAAAQYLKQNRVKEALHFFTKMFEREGIKAGQEEFLPQLVEKIQRIDRVCEEMLNRVIELSKKRNPTSIKTSWEDIDAQLKKDKIKKALSSLQELVDNYQVPGSDVRYILDQLPVILEVHQYSPFQPEKDRGVSSLNQQLNYCRERLDLFQASVEQMESQVFVQAGWTKKILAHLEQLLAQDPQQMDMIRQKLLEIKEMNHNQYSEEVIDFVIANSNKFSADYKNHFFKKKLEMLGVTKELMTQPSFFNVVTYCQGIRMNQQGYWEAVFNDGIALVYIPGGEFTMGVPWETGGAEDESPQHKVFLDSFWISKYEITFDQYDQFCHETGRGELYDYGRGRKNLPVIGVSWKDCQEFCQWLSMKTGLDFRLPTEAEWEKAARGTKARKYPWGNHKPNGNLTNFADVKFLKKYLELNPPMDEKDRKQKTDWIDPTIDDGYVFTAPVGSFPAGASCYGVMDMAGNVWEWVLDWYDDDYYHRSPHRNPKKTSVGIFRVARGGGWDCHPWLLRSTGRAGCDPTKGNDALGFRIVCFMPPAARGALFEKTAPLDPPQKLLIEVKHETNQRR